MKYELARSLRSLARNYSKRIRVLQTMLDIIFKSIGHDVRGQIQGQMTNINLLRDLPQTAQIDIRYLTSTLTDMQLDPLDHSVTTDSPKAPCSSVWFVLSHQAQHALFPHEAHSEAGRLAVGAPPPHVRRARFVRR